ARLQTGLRPDHRPMSRRSIRGGDGVPRARHRRPGPRRSPVTILSAVAPVDETPIDRYLQVQADLTAVERFSQRHEAGVVPVQARFYRDLIPLDRPEPGQQYAFAVDLDAC